MEKDVVCGMNVDPNTAGAKSEYKNKTYYFCCDGCRETFDKNPEKYVGVKPSAPAGHCCN